MLWHVLLLPSARLQRVDLALPHFSTAMPMLLADPSIMRSAASRFAALRSFIFICAISRTLLRLNGAALPRPGVVAAFSIPAAFLIKSEACGVLGVKANE